MRLLLAAVLAVATCSKPAPPAPAPEPAPPPAPAPAPPPEAPAPDATQDELRALDTYVGFSRDGLLFAWTEYSSGAGLPVLNLLSSTTNTIEKSVPLDSEATRRRMAAELLEEGFPRPGTTEPVPKEVSASLEQGRVVVRFGPVPASKTWKPFEGVPGLVPERAEVVAVSKDGRRVAVRVTGSGDGEFGPPREHRVVSLFE